MSNNIAYCSCIIDTEIRILTGCIFNYVTLDNHIYVIVNSYLVIHNTMHINPIVTINKGYPFTPSII